MSAEVTTDLAGRIRDAVAIERDRLGGFLTPSMSHRRRQCDLAEKILARHPSTGGTPGHALCARCGGLTPWPCIEVRDLAEAWGVEP